MFLCETICKKVTVEKVRLSLGFDGMIAVDSSGRSGGLALLWRNKDEVTLTSFNKNQIDVIVSTVKGLKYRITGIYGEPDRAKREQTWSLIRGLSSQNTLPWCLIGDMNNVLSQNDKRGGRPYPDRLIQGFKDVLNDRELTDLQLWGYQYIWDRGLGTSNHIEIRLDRALVTGGFINLFKDVKLTNLEISTSDHCPLLLEPKNSNLIRNKPAFRFENSWLREPMCFHLVKEVWNNNSSSLYDKLSQCSEVLSE